MDIVSLLQNISQIEATTYQKNGYSKKLEAPFRHLNGVEQFKKLWHQVNNQTEDVWISIGSGNGQIESELDPHFVCVDPKFMLDIPKPPLFETAEEIAKEHPEFIQNCNLLLNWCLPNNSTYDYDAIQVLQPKIFVSVIEVFRGENGAAGGEKFHTFLDKTEEYEIKRIPLVPEINGLNIQIVVGVKRDVKFQWNLPETITKE